MNYDTTPTAPRKLLLQNKLSPGDILVMSAAIYCLHEQYPGRFVVDVESASPAVYENNPGVTKLDRDDPDVQVIEMKYPLIDQCNQRPVHFLQGYTDYLGEQLGLPIRLTTNRPHIWVSEEERSWMPQVHLVTGRRIKYWLINAGTKQDYTTKGWGTHNFQELVDLLVGKVQFVQIGLRQHLHKPLKNVIDLTGRTDTRQLIRLAWHAEGAVGPISFLLHIFGAFQKPYVALNGGREPLPWEAYPTTTTMSSIGTLPCCSLGGCWRSRVVPLGDGDPKDRSLCELPVYGAEEVIPKCMALITPQQVVAAVERYYVGGVLTY